MRRIQKAGEPTELQVWRRTQGEPAPTFGTMPKLVASALREALLEEQGWICCYCMRAIDKGGSRIDHREPQESHPARQLDYRNLFLSCSGYSDCSRHCDEKKGNNAIEVDPLTVQATWFAYGKDGRMSTTRPEFVSDLETLGLNCNGLVLARKNALSRYFTTIDRDRAKGRPLSKKRLEQALSEVLAPRANGHLKPFCEMFAHWLRRRIERAG